MKLQELETFLHQQIPMARALGAKVLEASESSVKIFGPLSLNRNHLGTAFGGSLHSLLILAAYTWLYQHMKMKGHAVHVLIQSGQTDYHHPVSTDIEAICLGPKTQDLADFEKMFERKGTGRVTLECHIENSEGKLCSFQGVFIAQKSSESKLS